MENQRAIPQGYMTTGEVAKRMGVTVRTLQHYDREGLIFEIVLTRKVVWLLWSISRSFKMKRLSFEKWEFLLTAKGDSSLPKRIGI